MSAPAPVDTVPPELSEAEQKALDAQNAEREKREQEGPSPTRCILSLESACVLCGQRQALE